MSRPDASDPVIRVLLATLPPTLRTLVRDTVHAQPDMELLELGAHETSPIDVATKRPDVMIVPASVSGPPTCFETAALLLPGVRLLEIGGRSDRFVLRTVEMDPGTLSIAATIRAVASRARIAVWH